MSTRATMTTLIADVRAMVQASTDELSDEQIQAALDKHSQRILRHRLRAEAADLSDGLRYWWSALSAPWENRDSALSIVDRDGASLSIAESDLGRGLWQLAEGRSDGTVYLTDGYVYDVAAAAAEACSILIATYKSSYSFTSSAGSFSRSERIRNLEALAATYRAQARAYSLQRSE